MTARKIIALITCRIITFLVHLINASFFLWTRRSLLSFLNHKESQSMWSLEPGTWAVKEKPLNDHWTRTGQLALVRAFPCMSPWAWGTKRNKLLINMGNLTFGVTPFLLILLPCMPSQDLWQQPTVSWVTLPGILPSSYSPQPSIPDPGKFLEHKSFEYVPTAVFCDCWPSEWKEHEFRGHHDLSHGLDRKDCLAQVGHSTWLWVLTFTSFMTSQKSLLSKLPTSHLQNPRRIPMYLKSKADPYSTL